MLVVGVRGQAVRGGSARTSLGHLSPRWGCSGPGTGRFSKKSSGGVPSGTCQLCSGLRSASHRLPPTSAGQALLTCGILHHLLFLESSLSYLQYSDRQAVFIKRRGRLRGNGTELALHKINVLCGPSLYTHENQLTSVLVSPPSLHPEVEPTSMFGSSFCLVPAWLSPHAHRGTRRRPWPPRCHTGRTAASPESHPPLAFPFTTQQHPSAPPSQTYWCRGGRAVCPGGRRIPPVQWGVGYRPTATANLQGCLSFIGGEKPKYVSRWRNGPADHGCSAPRPAASASPSWVLLRTSGGRCLPRTAQNSHGILTRATHRSPGVVPSAFGKRQATRALCKASSQCSCQLPNND